MRNILGFYSHQGTVSSLIKTFQPVSITIPAGSSSNTVTITPVNTANAIMFAQGCWTGGTGNASAYVTLTNGSTVTANSFYGPTPVTINATVIEFMSGVNSIQSGTITISNGSVGTATGTATISPVSSNAFVIFLGPYGFQSASGGVSLTNSTTVTAYTYYGGNNVTVSYMVADLGTTLIKSAHQYQFNAVETGTAFTGTVGITTVTPGSAQIVYGGFFANAWTNDVFYLDSWMLTLGTAGTSVTTERYNAGSGNASSTFFSVIQWSAAILNGAVQRGTAKSAATGTTGSATISAVGTKSLANFTNQWAGATLTNNVFNTVTLTNSTTVTITQGTTPGLNAVQVGFEVIPFL